MAYVHTYEEKYTVEEYLNYKRKIHLDIVENEKAAKKILIENFKYANNIPNDDAKDIDLKTNKILLDVNRDLPINSELFCPILTPTERARIIRSNTNTGIDETESHEIKSIRKSRETCGCSCKQACLKETCSCILNGIGCQLDKSKFPCSCSFRRCENPCGFKKFDVNSVRKHYDKVLYNIEHVERSSKRRRIESNSIEGAKKSKNVKKRIEKAKKTSTDIKNLINIKETNNNEEIISNKCLDILPYQPFDLFKFIFKISKEIQEMAY